MEKSCFKCHEVKPLSEFYAHSRMADGHLNKCKKCTRSDVRHREEQLSSDPAWKLSELRRHRDKTTRYRLAGREKPIRTEKKALYIATYSEAHPQKHLAHKLVKSAIKKGIIEPERCECCGFPIAEAHHEDYSQPLDVRWLCSKHHAERHVKIREAQLIAA